MTDWSESLGTILSDYDLHEVELAGWSQDDLDKMAAGLVASEQDVDEDETPDAPTSPVTKPGDVWTLGRHTLVCCDGATIERRFDAVLTDPPYGVSVVKNNMVGADFGVAKKGRYEPIAGDDQVPDVRWILKRSDTIVIWGGNYFADQLPATSGWLVWDKRDNSGIENTFADCELAWTTRTGPARVHRQLWNGMIRSGEHTKRVHPTQKPVALMAWCLGFSEGVVFDPYLGSGTTLIAAEQLGRTCFGTELSPAYCDVIVQRWEKLTGQTAQRNPG